ncbi:hypothetical protein [Pseudactinotalea sp. Z1732]|uniref:hypothetical protein n=1 Tax=Micrococcales TaxID=85006 RepID=UPI003C7ACDFE
MSKTIHGIPEYLERDQWVQMIREYGFEPNNVVELRFAPNGVHALIFDLDENGARYLTGGNDVEYAKHRVFIPVREHADDEATTTIKKIET